MSDDVQRRSKWMLRALEWNDPKAKYPNLWSEGLPSTVLVFDTIARRLRIGDVIAVYSPASTRHPARSDRFVGLVRVAGLRRAGSPDRYWLDLEVAHRFRRPLDFGDAPRRVFLCCDEGWPAAEVALFRKVYDAAVAEGWQPLRDERIEAAVEPDTAAPADEPETGGEAPEEPSVPTSETAPPSETAPAAPTVDEAPDETARWFAGVSWNGDRRDPRSGTWLAIVRLEADDRLHLVRLEATGRHGAQGYLRDPDRDLMRAEATGCAFPFGYPEPFVEHVLGGAFPADGWWGMARSLERVDYPDFLIKLHDFRDTHGEPTRFTDERAGALSPLSRDLGDRASKSFHGIRMVAEDRSRFAVRPFENAQGRLLLEVEPEAASRDLATPRSSAVRPAEVVDALRRAARLPVDVEPGLAGRCRGTLEAVDAVLAARAAARAVLDGETDKSPEELAPDAPERVRREGWIYGVPV